jgi:hypothetical protein
MAEKTLQIEVQEDHLERISQTKKPILAIAELVWNALDADASRVTISLPESGLGRLDAIEVTDNGHSVAYSEIDGLFTKTRWFLEAAAAEDERIGQIAARKRGKGEVSGFCTLAEWLIGICATKRMGAFGCIASK